MFSRERGGVDEVAPRVLEPDDIAVKVIEFYSRLGAVERHPLAGLEQRAPADLAARRAAVRVVIQPPAGYVRLVRSRVVELDELVSIRSVVAVAVPVGAVVILT